MSREISLRERLVRYMRNNHTQWYPSGHLQRLVVEHTKHTPRSAVRRLQELHEEGILERKLIKNHTYYRYSGADDTPKPSTTPTRAPYNSQELCKRFDAGLSAEQVFA